MTLSELFPAVIIIIMIVVCALSDLWPQRWVMLRGSVGKVPSLSVDGDMATVGVWRGVSSCQCPDSSDVTAFITYLRVCAPSWSSHRGFSRPEETACRLLLRHVFFVCLFSGHFVKKRPMSSYPSVILTIIHPLLLHPPFLFLCIIIIDIIKPSESQLLLQLLHLQP